MIERKNKEFFLIKSYNIKLCPGGGIGRHKGLKIPRQQWRAGSSPAPGTNNVLKKFQERSYVRKQNNINNWGYRLVWK